MVFTNNQVKMIGCSQSCRWLERKHFFKYYCIQPYRTISWCVFVLTLFLLCSEGMFLMRFYCVPLWLRVCAGIYDLYSYVMFSWFMCIFFFLLNVLCVLLRLCACLPVSFHVNVFLGTLKEIDCAMLCMLHALIEYVNILYILSYVHSNFVCKRVLLYV